MEGFNPDFLTVENILNWVKLGVFTDEKFILLAYDILWHKIVNANGKVIISEENRPTFNRLIDLASSIRKNKKHKSCVETFGCTSSTPNISAGPSGLDYSVFQGSDSVAENETIKPAQLGRKSVIRYAPPKVHQDQTPPSTVMQINNSYGTSRSVLQDGGSERPGSSRNDTSIPIPGSSGVNRLHTYNHQQGNQERVGGDLKYITLIDEGEKEIKKFATIAKTLTFTFNDVDETTNPIVWLQKAFDEILTHVTNGASPSDRIGLVLRNENFADRPIGISFRRVDQLNTSVIMATLEKIIQSNVNFFAHDIMKLHVNRVVLPVGNGRLRLTGVTFEQFSRRKQGILTVTNYDNHCLARALILAKAWRENDPELDQYKLGHPNLDQKAFDLCTDAGVDLSNGGTREHVEQFQQYLTAYTIVVYNSRIGKSKYYEGSRNGDRKVLNLILENEHYNVITSLTSAFCTTYFCEMCLARTNSKQNHKNCPYICPCCHSKPPCQKLLENTVCGDCRRDFRGPECFATHKEGLCNILQRCNLCFMSYWKPGKSKHNCGLKFCFTCGKEIPIRHLCYMKKNTPSKKALNKGFIFVFYDFECRQETLLADTVNTYLHEPNLCVSQNVCNVCINIDDIKHVCDTCGQRQHIFKENPVQNLLDYISKLAGIANVFALAHNMKGYDGAFIMQAIVKQQQMWEPKIISNGTKLMSITCHNIKFLDSLNFLPVSLAKLPKAFKIKGSKGFFPHLFNTVANQHYIGCLPDPHYYMADEMSSTSRDEFFVWYNDEISKNTVFNMRKEIVDYCIQDVDILRKACVEFWMRYTRENSVDPFRECCTIAGGCSLVYRRKFLKENTIAIIPPSGYRMADKQSIIAIKWLLWIEHDQNIAIKHAGNGREVRLNNGVLVDGFCEETNTAYNFHGCYFHGCESCFPDQTVDLAQVKNESMFIRREKTEATASKIRASGCNLIEIWECQFKNYLKFNPEATEFITSHRVITNTPLNPRDSFFGGRTNAVKLYHKAEDNEVIRYFDVCSLYPFVNKYGKYPVGHPKLHIGDEDCRKLAFELVEGLIKCTVLPPQNLYHPVLPVRMHGKLMFILCKTCAETVLIVTL